MPRNVKRTRNEADSVAELDSDALDGDDTVPVATKTPRKTPRKAAATPAKDWDSDALAVPVTSKTLRKTPRKTGATPLKAKDDWDSDALDESSEDSALSAVKGKRKNNPKQPKMKRRRKEKGSEEEEEELNSEQEVVGVVVQAPRTGLVPPGRISKNTLDFLTKLKDKECNDRSWFKLHEPVYRQAEKEFRDFLERFTDLIAEADPQIPHLPPKDVVHRIYRDVRFSNDKTPYKGNFSASFSRSGRKGIFAGYHLSVKPGNESLIAAGTWCPGKNELATIRTNIQRSSRRLRQVVSSPTFVSYFGEARPHPKGQRQNIFGMEDELKVAPKGIAKDHRDIDLLKCRSFSVVHRFMDSEVLDPEFAQMVKNVIQVMRPFVHCLNDLMTVGYNEEEEEEEGQGEEEEEQEE